MEVEFIWKTTEDHWDNTNTPDNTWEEKPSPKQGLRYMRINLTLDSRTMAMHAKGSRVLTVFSGLRSQHRPRPSSSRTSPVFPDGRLRPAPPPPRHIAAPLTLLGLMPPPLRFAANISWLFPDIPTLPGRIRAAGRAGFRAVEVAWPYGADPGEMKAALGESNAELVLLNTPPGDVSAGELGLGAVPGRQDGFRTGLHQAVTWAQDLGCTRIHIMAGRVPTGIDRSSVEKEMEETFIENLIYAADILDRAGMVGLIEPINCRITEPRYFLNTPQQGASILQKVGRSNVKMQMDLYHWQIMDGNLTENIKTYFPLIGHVQVAQVPHRNEPDSPGELNFTYLYDLLQELGYQGYIGCEYKPRGDTAAGLGWLEDYRRRSDRRDPEK
ncbi:putative hydroxypyruvate isomerase [Hyla sarda]|uniref:putative hydroxypyruvate isomerase n=1 Tax=Hyla sarda TaxID=327740 RepID=UPI0024C4393F|nr:putative hydroxypyruvate isomerase [Hyla sarda]